MTAYYLTLEELAASYARRPRADAAMLPAMVAPGLAPTVPRNAANDPKHQAQLQKYYDALVGLYGLRPEKRAGTSRAMPYVHVPMAGVMLAWMQREARRWLAPAPSYLSVLELASPGLVVGKWLMDTPDSAKQPGFIKKWLGVAESIVGKVNDKGEVTAPNPASYEDVPAGVALRAQSRVGITRRFQHPQVLTAAATFDFFDALQRLAIHFDALAGQPSRLSLGVHSVGEAITELPNTIESIVTAPVKAAEDAASSVFKWVGWGLLGLGALWVVSR